MLAIIELNEKKSIHGYWCDARENEGTELITEEIDYWIERRKFFLSFVK